MADRHTKIRASQIFDDGIKNEDLNDEAKTGSVQIIVGDGINTVSTGKAGDIVIPFNCEIIKVTLLAEQTGSIQFDILKGTFAGHPTYTSVVASAHPTISSSDKSQDSTLTGWTKSISADDTLRFNVDSVTDIKRCTLTLTIKKVTI